MNLVLGFCGLPTKLPDDATSATPHRDPERDARRGQEPTNGGDGGVTVLFALVCDVPGVDAR